MPFPWVALVGAVVSVGTTTAKIISDRDRAYKSDHDFKEGNNWNHLWNENAPDTTPGSRDLDPNFFNEPTNIYYGKIDSGSIKSWQDLLGNSANKKYFAYGIIAISLFLFLFIFVIRKRGNR